MEGEEEDRGPLKAGIGSATDVVEDMVSLANEHHGLGPAHAISALDDSSRNPQRAHQTPCMPDKLYSNRIQAESQGLP